MITDQNRWWNVVSRHFHENTVVLVKVDACLIMCEDGVLILGWGRWDVGHFWSLEFK